MQSCGVEYEHADKSAPPPPSSFFAPPFPRTGPVQRSTYKLASSTAVATRSKRAAQIAGDQRRVDMMAGRAADNCIAFHSEVIKLV